MRNTQLILVILFSLSFLIANSLSASALNACAIQVSDEARIVSSGVESKRVLVIEGFGDVTNRFYIPELSALAPELAGKANYQIVFSDFSNPNESALEKEIRMRRVGEIEKRGFKYIDKRVSPEDYDQLRPQVVVLACPGKFYKPILQHWMAKENVPRVYGEKPVGESLDAAYDILESLPLHDPAFLAIDSYAYKIKRTRDQAIADIEWLGGIKHMRFIATENRSGSDKTSKIVEEFTHRDGAIERENRVAMLGHGVGADFLPHFFAVARYYLDVSKLRPINVYAFRYRGVDGDPKKETEITKETLLHSTFGGIDITGRKVQGQLSVGKGIRVREVGQAAEDNAKRFELLGNNGRRLIFDLRGSGEGAGTARYIGNNGFRVRETQEESNPYRALFREILLAEIPKQPIYIEDAVLFREKLILFTRAVGRDGPITVYDGGMGGVFERPAPYLEDLLEGATAIMGSKLGSIK